MTDQEISSLRSRLSASENARAQLANIVRALLDATGGANQAHLAEVEASARIQLRELGELK
jgi:transposase